MHTLSSRHRAVDWPDFKDPSSLLSPRLSPTDADGLDTSTSRAPLRLAFSSRRARRVAGFGGIRRGSAAARRCRAGSASTSSARCSVGKRLAPSPLQGPTLVRRPREEKAESTGRECAGVCHRILHDRLIKSHSIKRKHTPRHDYASCHTGWWRPRGAAGAARGAHGSARRPALSPGRAEACRGRQQSRSRSASSTPSAT
jgi:hypothetical protein